MLTADLVPARRRLGKLVLAKWNGARERRAIELAAAVLDVLAADVGEMRESVDDDLASIEVAPADLKLLRGLARLALQRCRFEAEEGDDPVALRAALFGAAAAARRAGCFHRERLVGEVAAARDLAVEQVERLLFADLKGTQLLVEACTETPEALVERYRLALHQAVLLRAVSVHARIGTRDGGLLRDLFRRLKFHRLLWRCERLPSGELSLHIDGPMALFAQSTRYGLELAVILPALVRFERWQIEAEVRWGRDRDALRFEAAGRRGSLGGEAAPVAPPDELVALGDAIARSRLPWRAEPVGEVYDVPGVGVFVPDLRLVRDDGAAVVFELLGFWSREAVFRRADLVAAGLGVPVVFAASERLRVSREVLADTTPAALVLYKGVISARAVVAAAEQMWARHAAQTVDGHEGVQP